jgi:hypothetical protein
MQGECHHRFLGAILGLLITEADYSVLDVVLHVKVAERVGLDAHVEVLLQLYAALLKTHKAPALKHLGVQQVPADPWHYLAAPVVSAVKAPPVNQLAV